MYRSIYCVLIFSLSLCLGFLSGCKKAYKSEEISEELAESPQMITKNVVSDYIGGALSATGGRELWMQTKEIGYDCVVAFHKPDGSFYLTEQNHTIQPWRYRIRISATEPHGKIVCELSHGTFKVLEGQMSKDGLSQGLCERDLSEVLREALCSAVSFLDKRTMFTRIDKPVRKEGSWYYAIERVQPDQFKQEDTKESKETEPLANYWSKVFYYQRTDSLLVDMLWFANYERQEYIGARCYNYSGIVERDSGLFERTGVFIPRKIEIFRSDSKGVFHNKIAEMDIKSCSYISY
ncbi:MAG: hypothetical protein ACYSSP_00205 [Planctomycetota bacterium]